MYGWYAPDPRMRANVGIRRRLAPLLDNSRAEIELIHALLLSLPGSPCLYYGDEIGMGDNIWLPDRDAVRTPMQWTPDRNAGFSTRRPGQALPAGDLQSLVYHYNNINVEAQMATQLLAAALGARRCSRSARATRCSGSATFEVCPADNDADPGVPAHGRPAASSTTSSPRRCSASTTCRAARRPASIRLPDQLKGAARRATSSAAAASPRSPTRRR